MILRVSFEEEKEDSLLLVRIERIDRELIISCDIVEMRR